MLRSQWLFKTVGATIITLIIGGMLASWQTETANNKQAHKAAFEAKEMSVKQQKDIDTLMRCMREEKTDRAVLWEKLNNIEQKGTATYDLMLKLWEKDK